MISYEIESTEPPFVRDNPTLNPTTSLSPLAPETNY